MKNFFRPLCRLFVLFAILNYSACKPPKNLSRLRQKGKYSAVDMNIPSLTNQGLLLAEVYGNTTSAEQDESPPIEAASTKLEPKKTTAIRVTATVTRNPGARKGRNSDEEKPKLEGEENDKEDESQEPDDIDEILAGDLGEQLAEEEVSDAPEESQPTTAPQRIVTTTTLEDIARITAYPVRPIEQPQSASTEILERLLSKGYDWRVRPHGLSTGVNGGPVVVNVNMLIRSISKIDNVNMEYSVQLTFRETWMDPRLKYGVKGDSLPDFLILTAGQQIWMPDSFFQNEKQAYKHMIDKPNVMIRVHKDGMILYSVRISLVLSCPMELHDYPMDVQKCVIELASYAYTTNDIEYVWKKDEPVQLKKGLNDSLPSFFLDDHHTSYCTSKTTTGSYSCLRTAFYLKRQFSYYLLQLYIPSTMLVIVSWVSFWIERTAVPARVTLGVTTLLTMTTQSSGIAAKLPPVAYIKAIDVWIGACMTFIFSALLEFAWVTYVANRNDIAKKKLQVKRNSMLTSAQPTEEAVWVPRIIAEQEREISKAREASLGSNRKYSSLKRWLLIKTDWHDKSKRADLVSRVLFPVSFLLFNIMYWTKYRQSSSEKLL